MKVTKMPDIVPLYDVRMLTYRTETVAKIAISNGTWLVGEWLAQGKPGWDAFIPEVRYILKPRCRDEALARLDALPEDIRHRFFTKSFQYRPHTGERFLEVLMSQHKDMLHEALRLEWRCEVDRFWSLKTPTADPQASANHMLARPVDGR